MRPHVQRSTARLLRDLAEQVEGCRARTIGEYQIFEFAVSRVGLFRSIPIPRNVQIAKEMLAAVSADPMLLEVDGKVVPAPIGPMLWEALEGLGEWSLSHADWGRSYAEAWAALPHYAWCLQGSQDNAAWVLHLAADVGLSKDGRSP